MFADDTVLVGDSEEKLYRLIFEMYVREGI